MKIIKTEIENNYSFAVLIKDKQIKVWFNVWKDNAQQEEFYLDWNKYIFFINDKKDMEIKTYQENCKNFDKCSSFALEYVENYVLLNLTI